jgi:hypothetical protein
VTNFHDFDWLLRAIIASFVIPFLCIPINHKWSSLFSKNDLPGIGKIAYRNFLIINSKPISEVFSKIEKYKRNTWMKCFWFIEGIPLGIITFIILLISCFMISEIRGFNNLFLLKPFYSYLNYGQKDKDLVGILIVINLLSGLMLIVISLYHTFFISKGYREPKLTEKLSLKKSSKYYYYSIWFSMGLIIGSNILILYYTYCFYGVVIEFIKSSFNGDIFYTFSLIFISIYILSIGMGCVLIISYYNHTKLFSNLFKQMVQDSYIDEFPHIRIKTNGEYILGKIDNILNESLIILNDGHLVKAIRWDHITTMVIEKEL